MGEKKKTHTHTSSSLRVVVHILVNRTIRLSRDTSFGVSTGWPNNIDSGQVYDIIVESSTAISSVCVCVASCDAVDV